MRTALLLGLLVLATLGLRLWGVDHLLPYWIEPDAHIAPHAELLRRGGDASRSQWNDEVQYPLLLPGTIALLPALGRATAPNGTLEEHLEAAGRIYFDARVWIAVLSVLVVPLTYLLARRFLQPGWALFASALMATSLLHQLLAQQARPHGAAVVPVLLAVLSSMRLARAPTWKSYLLAGLAAVLAIGSLQSGLSVLVPLCVAALLVCPGVVHEPASRLYGRLAALPLLVVGVGLGSLLSYPFLIGHGPGADYGHAAIVRKRIEFADHQIALRDLDGYGFVSIGRILLHYEPVLLTLVLVALLVWALRRRAGPSGLARWTDSGIAASYVLANLLVLGIFHHTYERFVIPLLPFLATFAAWGLASLGAQLGPRAARALATLALASLVLPAFASCRLAWLRAREDTLASAGRWLAANLSPADDVVYLLPSIDVPLVRYPDEPSSSDPRPAHAFSPWGKYLAGLPSKALPAPRFHVRAIVPIPELGFDFERTGREPDLYLDTLGGGFFVIDASRRMAPPAMAELRAALGRKGRLVYRSAPESEGPTAEWGLHYQDEWRAEWPSVLARVLRARAVGPVVEIYELARAEGEATPAGEPTGGGAEPSEGPDR